MVVNGTINLFDYLDKNEQDNALVGTRRSHYDCYELVYDPRDYERCDRIEGVQRIAEGPEVERLTSK